MENLIHTSVLLHESIDGLALTEGKVYLDGTLGSGGHALAAAKILGKEGIVIGIDQDTEALARTQARFDAETTISLPKTFFIQNSYRNLSTVLAERAVKGDISEPRVDAIMLDLGLSSDQFETSGRGFSFKKDEPLLMTFATKATLTANPEMLTAHEIVNTWEEENIADIIYGYGEERFARKIARGIVKARETKTIETTFELIEIIKQATPGWYHHGKIHPATRTFQALRITVNDEIGALKDGLKNGFESLRPQGRFAIISFHSLEDRLVKKFFREKADQNLGVLVTKKPITPSDEERTTNPRSRSAKLRIIEKI